MKKCIWLLLFLFLNFSAISQEWSELVNVSNMEGIDYFPDFCIDNNNVIHCVWSHKVNNDQIIVYYAKSTDDGMNWSSPENISFNGDVWCLHPHIVSDSQNHLFVTYDYDTGSTSQSLVFLKMFDGNSWSNADTVSEGMPGAFKNTMNIDYSNRVYCFWYNGALTGYFYYRYFENGIWSQTLCPYSGNNHIVVLETVIDPFNNVHCLGALHIGLNYDEQASYFMFDNENNIWSDICEVSGKSSGMDAGIDIDIINYPHITWRQKTYLTGPNNDSTMYRFFDGNTWKEPELIVEDPYNQKLQITNNKVYILNWEKGDPLNNIVIYEQNNSGNWIGEIVISVEIMVPEKLLSQDFTHHLLLYGIIEDNNYEIYYMNKEIDTTTQILHENFSLDKVNITPNPFRNATSISFTILKPDFISLNIFDLAGRHVTTLMNEFKIPGNYNLLWDGNDINGNVVNSGLYLVRLQCGRNILTRSVECLKK